MYEVRGFAEQSRDVCVLLSKSNTDVHRSWYLEAIGMSMVSVTLLGRLLGLWIYLPTSGIFSFIELGSVFVAFLSQPMLFWFLLSGPAV